MTTVERAFNECHDQIYQHALSIVKNTYDAEDIRSNVYFKIQNLESAQYHKDKKASLSTWVYKITNHVILDFFRTNHQKHYKMISDFKKNSDDIDLDSPFQFIASTCHNADTMILRTETRNQIVKALRSLKPNYRKIAYYYFLKDLSYNEIAELLDIPMGSVKGMLSRCRTKLKKELKGMYTLKPVKSEMSKV